MLRGTVTVTFCLCLLSGLTYSRDYYVSTHGSDGSGDGSMEKPWRTIQYGLDQAALLSTDTVRVHVGAGTYQEEILVEQYEEIYGGYDYSTNPWKRDWAQFVTRLENPSEDPLQKLVIAHDGAVVDGFHMVGSNYMGVAGYACTIRNNIITNCSLGISGGKYILNNRVYSNRGTGMSGYMTELARDNIVMWNGGFGIIGVDQAVGNVVMFNYSGISCRIARNNIVRCNLWSGIQTGGDSVIEGNVISDTGWYGAIYGDTINGTIKNNIITRCYRGIIFDEGNPEIRNNVIAGCGLGIASGNGWPRIRNCIFWDNGDDVVSEPWDIKYCLTGDGYPGEGNISTDPKFVGWGEFALENPLYVDVNYRAEEEDGTAAHPYKTIWKALAAYDFHLSEDSPCIGAGEGGVDVGAYPGVSSYSPLHSPSARVDVMPGTYHEYNLHPGNRVWLRGAEGPKKTVIKGTGDGYLTPRIFQLSDRAIIDGFTIDGGLRETDAIVCANGSTEDGLRAVVMNCRIMNSSDAILGSWREGSADIVSCLLWYNDVGAHLAEKAIVANSLIYVNETGLYLFVPGSDPGLSRYGVRNCILWASRYSDVGQLAEKNYLRYCDIEDGATDPTNFSENPMFAEDFHLAWYSPCRNRGTEQLAPVFDPEGRLRGQEKRVDVGLYEYEEGWVWSFPGGATQDWVGAGAPMTFSEPEFPWSDGGLLMRATSNTDCFGYWGNEMKEIAYVEDSVYELRWETKRTVRGLNRYPVMRLRTNTDNFEESTMIVINASGELTGGTETGVYTLYLVRPEQFLEHPGQGYRKLSDTERLLLAFDMLNFDPAADPHGEIFLDKIEVFHSRFRKDWQLQQLTNFDFESGADGWTPSGEIAPFAATQDSWTSGMLALQSTTNTNCFGFWESPVIELPTTAIQSLLLATFTVKSDQEAGTSPFPMSRLRIIREDSSEVAVKTIEGKGSRAPGLEPHDYTVCYWLAAQPEPHRVRLAFDLVNFDPEASASATLFLDNVNLALLSRR
jgi:hypothetical protein